MTPAMKLTRLVIPIVILAFSFNSFALAQAAQQGAGPAAAVNPLTPGQKLASEGKLDEAIAFYQKAIQANPTAWDAYLGLGSAQDLKGDYGAARENIQKGIDAAPPNGKVRALRTMAVSYAFSGDATHAGRYEEQAYKLQFDANDLSGAAGTADEAARIFLENGDLDNAQQWYAKGHSTALSDAKLSAADKDLWTFRWESAQARIAARRGNKAEAQQHLLAAKAALDKGSNPEQAQFLPYLEGYVAFYGGDYPTAISDLEKANQKDPFILVLIAQAYEKSGDQKNAMDYYHKVLNIYSHNPTGAFARPLAQKKAGGV
jgi:tetratricopeptide (TPR) repeat protein